MWRAETLPSDVEARDVANLLLLAAIGAVTWNGLGILDVYEVVTPTLLSLLAP